MGQTATQGPETDALRSKSRLAEEGVARVSRVFIDFLIERAPCLIRSSNRRGASHTLASSAATAGVALALVCAASSCARARQISIRFARI